MDSAAIPFFVPARFVFPGGCQPPLHKAPNVAYSAERISLNTSFRTEKLRSCVQALLQKADFYCKRLIFDLQKMNEYSILLK